MNGETKEIVFGALTLAALILVMAFLYGGRQIAAQSAGTGYPVTATFNRVDGLLPGDPVRLGGVKVGYVEYAVLDPNFRAKLGLRINNSVQLPEDTSAAVHTDGLFGGKFIVLLPGGEDTMIVPGGAITFTQQAVVVEELLELIIAEGKAHRAKEKGRGQKQEPHSAPAGPGKAGGNP